MAFLSTKKIPILIFRRISKRIPSLDNRKLFSRFSRHEFFNYKRMYLFSSNLKNILPPCSLRNTVSAIKILYPKTFNKCYYCTYSEISNFHLSLPCTSDEAKEVFSHDPVSPPNSKLLKMAVIGVPNSGKSTLINRLMGWKLCCVSDKVHTTQCSARAVYNKGETQLVFVDTPGLLTAEEVKKYRPKDSMVVDPELSLQKADLIAVVHDISNRFTRNELHPSVLRLLTLYSKIPSILILNKIDVLRMKNRTVALPIIDNVTEGILAKEKIPDKKIIQDTTSSKEQEERLRKKLLGETDENLFNSEQKVDNSLTEYRKSTPGNILEDESSDLLSSVSETSKENEYTELDVTFEDVLNGKVNPTENQVQKLISGKKGWPGFTHVFVVSALRGIGMDYLKNYLLTSAKKDKWIFSEDVHTDQSPHDIALMTVRSRCLSNLRANIPYQLKFRLLYWKVTESGLLTILVHVLCSKENVVRILKGRGGRTIRKIALEAEQDLRDIFRTEVRLQLGLVQDAPHH